MKEQKATPQSILIHTAQEDLSERKINLWPNIHATLVSSRTISHPGDLPMSTQRTNKFFLSQRLVIGAGFVLVMLIAVFVLVPNKDVLAEAIKHLFQPVEAEQFPTPSDQELATPTFASTFAAQLVPIQETEVSQTAQPAPTGTQDTSLSTCEKDPYGYICKIAQAEKRAGFDAKEFPSDPKGFTFRSVLQAKSNNFMMEYVVIGGGGYLYLSQGLGNQFPSGTGEAPESAITEVMVGNHRGEYVEGMWVTDATNKKYTWNACCMARLRWVDGDRWFEIYKQAAMPQTNYMTREVMIDMALNLVNHPDQNNTPRLEYLNLEEASKLVNFKILTPGILPDEFRFGFASFTKETNQLHLNYYPGGNAESGTASILITETPLSEIRITEQENLGEMKVEKVEINGFPGTYFSSDPGNHILTWRTHELEISLIIRSNEYYGGTFAREQVLEMAKSMK